MKASVFSFTRNGAGLGLQLKDLLQAQEYEVGIYSAKALSEPLEGPKGYDPDLNTVVKQAFQSCSLLVFIGACGIAVRLIAPYIRDKRSDPAVICLDEKGTFVIPLLSGHIGGANKLALFIAEQTGAQPVVTTATDLHGLMAVDLWAAEHNLYIQDMEAAKKISALFLEGKTVGLESEFEIAGEVPPYILSGRNSPVGICIALDDRRKPFATTLNLIPRIACLGLGCRKGVSLNVIEELVEDVLGEEHISRRAIAGIATIDLKKEETGLRELAAKYRLPLIAFTARELGSVCGEFTESPFVRQVAGIGNVCERAAVLLSGNGKLIVPKRVQNGVTLAVAQKNWKVDF
ncbi:cobalamin (vitamin B12) biosynthesis CbiG protein [Syntrophobotulus glycolicus DSM 8271]|uniref:Cobalamin (Vitamin B12) biosynthesis CbiG protein n=1 Tax=Syntrophobotulus glycolicus (strain DSM 8271 / FlGlyR) TaxID=645991 RepID=F0SZ42_SYNGF|nr:cobalt-precorrin 5A hydrolase [Syntrophobotulus glycolicus]ADY57160.1 cobalamin (vitamin B12) biosynthesis CbiG protein [Syntrophobotulus glycolicus DSM 8271]